MKVAIYCRVSTDDKGQDPKVQLLRCQTYCANNNHTIVHELLDEGWSGDTYYADRKAGKLLHAAIMRGEVEGIVVFSIDRFSRQDPIKILTQIQEFERQGIKIMSVTEPVFDMTSDFAQPMRYLLAWFGNYWLTQHKRKVNSGMEKAKKYGTKSGKAIGRERKADYSAIIALHQSGKGISEIARTLGVSKGSVSNAVRKGVVVNTPQN